MSVKIITPTIPAPLRKLFLEFDLPFVGIANAKHHQKDQITYSGWIKENHHGKMGYLANHEPLKTNPQELLSNCQSIILVGLNYYQKSEHKKGSGKIAKYAWGRDYHKVLKNKLKKITNKLKLKYPNENFYFNTDATPLLERKYAEQAGLGFIGKNTMLISQPYGSWFLIGEILTTKTFPTNEFIGDKHGVCGSCTRCITACPTGAITKEYTIDARKCISYLTIEHKGSIPKELRPKIGEWLFGCDICQDVCPHNIRAKITKEPDFVKHISGPNQELKTILQIKDDQEFTKKFAGSPIMRTKREGLIRNACVVAGNLKESKLLPELKSLSQDKNPIIAEHATWAITQILADKD